MKEEFIFNGNTTVCIITCNPFKGTVACNYSDNIIDFLPSSDYHFLIRKYNLKGGYFVIKGCTHLNEGDTYDQEIGKRNARLKAEYKVQLRLSKIYGDLLKIIYKRMTTPVTLKMVEAESEVVKLKELYKSTFNLTNEKMNKLKKKRKKNAKKSGNIPL